MSEYTAESYKHVGSLVTDDLRIFDRVEFDYDPVAAVAGAAVRLEV